MVDKKAVELVLMAGSSTIAQYELDEMTGVVRTPEEYAELQHLSLMRLCKAEGVDFTPFCPILPRMRELYIQRQQY